MSQTKTNTPQSIPEQNPISWGIAFSVSWRGLKRRFLRLLITMAGVVLAIAFLAYMLITSEIRPAISGAYRKPPRFSQYSRLSSQRRVPNGLTGWLTAFMRRSPS